MGPVTVPPGISPYKLRLALGFAALLGACKPGIGDPCTTSTDCSQTGDRLCDISQPFGYCTIYNCEPSGTNAASKCPDGSVCVAFAAEPSPLDACANSLGSTPYQRSFCLKQCDNSNDCRDQYACRFPSDGNRRFAVDVDGNHKVCMVAAGATAPVVSDESSAAGASAGVSTDVCTGSSYQPDAGTDVPTAGAGPDGDMSNGGGAGGVSGAGGGSP